MPTKREQAGWHSTTILAVRRNGLTALGGDGQVTLDKILIKQGARKVRRIYKDQVLTGFAGATADAFALLDHFEAKLEENGGNLQRASVELAKLWRTDRMLRRLEAMMVVADASKILLLSGTGDVIEPDDDVIGIGSGGAYAQAAALALHRHSDLDAEAIVRESLAISGQICIYSNTHLTVETVSAP